MSLIKSARIYGVPLPAAPTAEMLHLLEKLMFQEPAAASRGSQGFIATPLTGELVTAITGGWSVCVRFDEKILPAAAVNKNVLEKVAELEEQQGRKVYRKEKLAIKDDVIAMMLPVAFIKTFYVHALYHAESQLLVINTGSVGDAETALSLLREALGTLRAVPLWIDPLQQCLTERLAFYLHTNGQTTSPPLGLCDFDLSNYLQLEDYSGQKLTIQSKSADEFTLERATEALRDGYRVRAISLVGTGGSFKLTHDQVFKSIVFDDPAELEDFEDSASQWRHETAIELMVICNQVRALLAMTGSIFPEPQEA